MTNIVGDDEHTHKLRSSHGAKRWVHQINSSLRKVDFSLYQDLLLIITKEPIFTLHMGGYPSFSSLAFST